MTWLLSLTLASGLVVPIYTDEAPCKYTAAFISEGGPGQLEFEDGRVELVVKAECTQGGLQS